MDNKSQTQKIKDYLLKGKTLTALQALKKFGCLRLASRINELRETHTIVKEWVHLPNGKRVIKYGIAFMFSLFLLTSCSIDSGKNQDAFPLGNHTIDTFELDGCEYVYLRRYGSVAITHKGNCKNHETGKQGE